MTEEQQKLYEALTLAGKCHLSNIPCPPELCRAFGLPFGLTWREVTTLGKVAGGIYWLWAFIRKPLEVAKFIWWKVSQIGR